MPMIEAWEVQALCKALHFKDISAALMGFNGKITTLGVNDLPPTYATLEAEGYHLSLTLSKRKQVWQNSDRGWIVIAALARDIDGQGPPPEPPW